MRAFEDPARGMVVTVTRAGADPEELSREAYETYEVQLQQSGAMILDHWGFEGRL